MIKLPKEFNYELNLEFLKRSPRELLHSVEGNSVLKALKFGEEKVLVRIRPATGKLIVEMLNGDVTPLTLRKVRTYITDWFDVKTDLKPFYTSVKKDPLLGPLVKRFFGYRIIGQPDLFESLTWAILGQQINLQFAYTLKHRFVEKFGERLHWNNESYYMFPTPAVVASLTDDHLLPLQFSRQKSKYVVEVANAFATGILSKEKISGLSFDDAKAELMKIKGIGNWTANYGLMKTFRHPESFPLEDAGVHNAIKNLKGLDRKPTLTQVKRIFKKYAGWEAYATLYLWKSL